MLEDGLFCLSLPAFAPRQIIGCVARGFSGVTEVAARG
jgi:hypothetical protein